MANPSAADEAPRRTLLYHFARVQLPRIQLPRDRFDSHLDRSYAIYLPKQAGLTWTSFLDGLFIVDWLVSVGCLENREPAWEMLFAARTGRSDCLLVDALRARAARLYPRDAEKQETAVDEFWSNLIASPNGTAILAKYDGQRPLTPWLIRVFQNLHLSKLRRHSSTISLPDDEIAMALPSLSPEDARWHDLFNGAAREWLNSIADSERVLLGLRWRYKLNQRDVAGLLDVHEGTISRQTDKLRDRALDFIGRQLTDAGWIGDDLESYILTELGSLLTDDPRLGAEHLGRLLQAQGKSLPD
jgi:RNA polymerase sigma factor (sigma-70 family)